MTIATNPWRELVPAIPDKYFEHGPVPMTKEEVRNITLAKAKIRPEAVIYVLLAPNPDQAAARFNRSHNNTSLCRQASDLVRASVPEAIAALNNQEHHGIRLY